MRRTAHAVLFLAFGFTMFCAHQGGSEIMVDDPDFAEFTVYNSGTHQQPKNARFVVRPEEGEGVGVRVRTKRACSPVIEVIKEGNIVGEARSIYRRAFGTVSADSTIEFIWDLCWSPEIVSDIELMDVSRFHKRTMWLDDEGRFLLMPLILERPDLYPVEEGQFLPDPYDYSKVFNTYRECDNGGIIVLGAYFVCIWTESDSSRDGEKARVERILRERRALLHETEGYERIRWRMVRMLTSDPSYTPRKWPKRDSPSVEELRGD